MVFSKPREVHKLNYKCCYKSLTFQSLGAFCLFLCFRNWACWLLSMRRVASPKAQTTPFWKNCTADTQ